ncbi:phage baseplate assembly protein V [Iodobacter sp.]|uniref:phage baseplate assembly protein V n=1 Tax=Iodobacter sp. TaxID=1915058 RepID=UPI0025D24F46|nr:phage baseplate assembly protein V [Iodobacter sp.]
MEQNADIARRLESMIRIGTIAEVRHYAPPACTVATGGLTTTWLPWLELRAGKTKTWNPPTIGEQCVLLCPSGDPAQGIVLYGIESSKNPAPSGSPDETLTVYPDGARISYNHVSHALVAIGVKTALIQAASLVKVDCPETETTGNLTVKGNLIVAGTSTLKSNTDVLGPLSYAAGLSGQGGAGGSTTITGPIKQSGGELSSNGVVLASHTHGGVQAGGSSTAGPK